MADLPPDIAEKIIRAQTVAGIPPTEPFVRYRSIAELLDRQADLYDQKPFLVFYTDEGQRYEFSFASFHEEVCRTANFLLASGIRPGDRVATVATNHADTVVQYFAAFLIGAAVVPVNTGEDDRRISYVLANSATRLAFVRDRFVERISGLRAELPGLSTIVQVGSRVNPSLPHLQTDVASFPARCVPPRSPVLTDEALVVYTSGTTGMPKGVVLTHHNLLADAMAIAEWHHIGDDQRMMCVLPIHHVNGIVVTLLTPLYAGAGIVLNQRFQVEKFFGRIAIERVSVVSVVPTLLQFLLHARPDTGLLTKAHLRHLICGAGPLTVELALKFELEFGIPIIHGYGLSETTCYSCFLPIDLPRGEHKMWLSRYGFPSIGTPLPINEMTIHDPEGQEVEEEVRGEIVIRGHNVMKHYFGDTAANERAFAHDWFRSGDEGFYRYDELGRKFFFITGRLKELIIRGGVNISPFEIDEVLMSLPGLAAGIAVGFENDWYGEEVGAYVKRKEGMELSAEEVLTHCRKHLPFAKSPKVVVFGDTIPVTSTGKYQRTLCKDLFLEWKGVQFREP